MSEELEHEDSLPKVFNPCTYDPLPLKGKPIGMFHCPLCGEMILAGIEHPKYWLFPPEENE